MCFSIAPSTFSTRSGPPSSRGSVIAPPLPSTCHPVRDGAQRSHPRHEEVLAAPRRHEVLERREEERALDLDRHLAPGSGAGGPEQVVLVVAEPEDVAVLKPRPLDAFELARDARLDAHADEPAIRAVVGGRPRPAMWAGRARKMLPP